VSRLAAPDNVATANAARKARKQGAMSKQCCEVKDAETEPDTRYGKTQIDVSKGCHIRAEGQMSSKGADELASVQDLFTAGAKKHLGRSETETIKWQYIGSEEGWWSTYPGKQDTACDAYDPRFRPWYAAAASVAKAVIVIVDSSGSMASEGRMAAAKSATNTVIDTLDAADSVAVIDFDNGARTASEGMYAHARLCRADAVCAVLMPAGRARVSTNAITRSNTSCARSFVTMCRNLAGRVPPGQDDPGHGGEQGQAQEICQGHERRRRD